MRSQFSGIFHVRSHMAQWLLGILVSSAFRHPFALGQESASSMLTSESRCSSFDSGGSGHPTFFHHYSSAWTTRSYPCRRCCFCPECGSLRKLAADSDLPLVRCRTTSQPPDGAKRSPAVRALFEDRLAPFYRRRTPLADWESISVLLSATLQLPFALVQVAERVDRMPSGTRFAALLPQFIRSLSEPLADGANDTLERCADGRFCDIRRRRIHLRGAMHRLEKECAAYMRAVHA